MLSRPSRLLGGDSHGDSLQMLPVMTQTALAATQNGGDAAEISKNYFLISSLIAPVSSLTFRTIRTRSRGALGTLRDGSVS